MDDIQECERLNELYERLEYAERLLKSYRRLAITCKDYVIDFDDYALIMTDLKEHEEELKQ